MARATVWTMGLFGAGAAISRMFTAGWVEPLVLVALGLALLFVSRSGSKSRVEPEGALRDVTATTPAPRAKPVPVPATVAQPWTARPAPRGAAAVPAVTAERTV